MKTTPFLIIGFLIYLGMFSAYVFGRGDIVTIISDGGSVAISFIAALLSFFCFRASGKNKNERISWALITVAFLLRFVGETFWGVYEVFLSRELPTPSFADAVWQLSYLVVFVGLVYKMRSIETQDKGKLVTRMLVLATIIAAAYIYVQENLLYFDFYRDVVVFTHRLNYSYVVLDFFILGMIAACIIAAALGRKPNLRHIVLLGFAFASFSIFDGLFAQRLLFDTYQSGSIIDTFYDLGYFLLIYAAHAKYQEVQNKNQ